MKLNIPSTISKINSSFLEEKEVEIFIKRDDLIHSVISGNKWRKLNYNLQAASDNGRNTVLSFGGAYSNHLHALSYASKMMGFNSIGVIRGDKKKKLTSTLAYCHSNNMKLFFLDRLNYRNNKYNNQLLRDIKNIYGDFYIIPEGGNNQLGVIGCQEIIKEVSLDFDYFCCAVGTGCTSSGIIRSLHNKSQFIGFAPFTKIIEQKKNILKYCPSDLYNNWTIIPDKHFGGYSKINSNLIKFICQFNNDHNIQLDLIYMGKLFYNLYELIQKDFFEKKTRIIVLHSGGLQGNDGFNSIE